MIANIILISLIVFSVILAGLFAGAETGIYQLSRLRLRLGIEKKRLSFVILGKALRNRAALLLSTLLGNNLAHCVATSIVTYMLLRYLEAEHTAQLLATFITVPTLFVFAELVPKSVFYYRSDSLMPRISPVLFVFDRLFTFCGAVPLLRVLSGFFARLTGSASPSAAVITAVHHPVRAIVQEMREEGLFSGVQTDIMDRLTEISHLSINSVMTPISRVEKVDLNSDRPTLLEKLKRYPFTRLLVYEGQPANIVGFINIYDSLSSAGQFTDLRGLLKPIRRLVADTSVIDAMNVMQSENQKIVLVTQIGPAGREKPVGIITIRDLL